MTASVAREGRSSSPTLDGRTIRLGPSWYLCRHRLPTAMPIPLAVASPGDVDLATWAFAGMKAPSREPTCLLLLRPNGIAPETALERGTRLVVATHFHDIAVSSGPAEAPEALEATERAVIAQAVLSAVTAGTVAALASLFPLLAPALRAMPIREDAPDLAIDPHRPGTCSLSGTAVPDYLLLDSDAGTRCVRVATARLAVSPQPRVDLDLEPLWGPGGDDAPGHAVLVGGGRSTPARLRAAGA